MPIIRKTQTAEDFEKVIEAYRIQNPVKFALKEKALMAKLASLKGEVEPEVKTKSGDPPKFPLSLN